MPSKKHPKSENKKQKNNFQTLDLAIVAATLIGNPAEFHWAIALRAFHLRFIQVPGVPDDPLRVCPFPKKLRQAERMPWLNAPEDWVAMPVVNILRRHVIWH